VDKIQLAKKLGVIPAKILISTLRTLQRYLQSETPSLDLLPSLDTFRTFTTQSAVQSNYFNCF